MIEDAASSKPHDAFSASGAGKPSPAAQPPTGAAEQPLATAERQGPQSAAAAPSTPSPALAAGSAGSSGEQRSPRWLQRGDLGYVLVCLLIVAGGMVLRYVHLFYLHSPNDFVFSDMQGYVNTANGWFDKNHQFGPPDALAPPAYHWMLGYLFSLDPTKGTPHPRRTLAIFVQFLMSIAVPPMLGLMAWQMYGRRVALLTMILSSVYFPFIDYAGYFLTEGPFLFSLVLSMLLLTSAIRAREPGLAMLWALLGGATLGCSANLKPAVLPGAGLVFLWLAAAAWKHRWRRLVAVLATSLLGLAAVMVPLSIRASRLTGYFVLVSSNGPMNMQQGHAGENVSGVKFSSPEGTWQWGSPTTSRKAELYREEMQLAGLPADPNRYAVTDQFDYTPWNRDRLYDEIWRRLREAPLECLEQSISNVLETFFTAPAWPSFWQPEPWHNFALWSQRLYIWLILLPAFLHLSFHRRALLDMQGPGLADVLMALPVIGVAITVFLATPEIRYRVPFDAFAIVLASRFYTRGSARSDGLMPADDVKKA